MVQSVWLDSETFREWSERDPQVSHLPLPLPLGAGLPLFVGEEAGRGVEMDGGVAAAVVAVKMLE